MTDFESKETGSDYSRGYSETIDVIREREYPLLKDITYLDHAGTTLYAKTLIESFSRDLTSNLYGNPHSLTAPSQLSTQRIDDTRLRALRFFNANPEEFDLVFVANATAAIKLVADALRDATPQGFWYGYHVDAHTSLVGARELAALGSRCFTSDEEVDRWVSEPGSVPAEGNRLFAFPAQSNMNGRRFPLEWSERVRASSRGSVHTLLDAASLVSTSPLDLSNAATAPDFTVLSFYKIFGFPDLGALIVRKSAGHLFNKRRFFGGGTVDMVTTHETAWHAKKRSSIHEQLEDGTLPFHNIIALDLAFETHARLFGSMANVSTHTRFLAGQLYDRMVALRHHNGERLCHIYTSPRTDYSDSSSQGPILAFNLRDRHGTWIGKSEVERLAGVKKIQIRSGTLCNPGGTAASLDWTGADMLRHFSSGLRCGDDHDIMDGRPTGILRVSLGAMSSLGDINTFMAFLEEFFVEKSPAVTSLASLADSNLVQEPGFYVESLSIYPIKSCAAFKVSDGQRWEIHPEGLAWDREWCLIHQGTGAALNQKRYPRMALIRPTIDLVRGLLRITCGGASSAHHKTLEIPLRRENLNLVSTSLCQNSSKPSTVCGDQVIVQAYTSHEVSSFFSSFLNVPCTLARFPPQMSMRSVPSSGALINRSSSLRALGTMPGSFPQDPLQDPLAAPNNPILLSNESPILLISRSSVNRLNEAIKRNNASGNGGNNKAVAADVFRANIVVAENPPKPANAERPYVEDEWQSVRIGPDGILFNVLGSCQRCQMVCVDQYTGVRGDEPYSTLAKTRKRGSKIYFGRHLGLAWTGSPDGEASLPVSQTLMVGDNVDPSFGS
ncbi:putative molybdenum cofactor sulfurase protein (HxB) [Aspergillus saccharolyticus JOP 1030-1]|uniref:Molybdenum cofactor sulfurase n=1 Tax=Aspergillus saccharolyticus JOP 1030-1 TaxID=1450539 RepID=A0A318Z0R7_9EURO|nr:molybdenum cofactor sulfurase protein [Aspergillus saccharolyticus JOP 1030-1]PYH40509.1 molybdenum cofactor sulfurase protein [Aspergillus saccharolyticus JOP 1030-1]